jgi:hypothetical protein
MSRPTLVHCSYHKCLTVYFRRVFHGVFNRCLPLGPGYRHYNSHLDAFYEGFERDRVSSVNNRLLELERLGDFRLTRFVRDPRDLVVSGYFYHRRGAEPWTLIERPSEADWYFANGVVPAGMREAGTSFASYLSELDQEQGLLAELEFRQAHFDSMAAWPEHPHVRTFRYEDVLGDEQRVFDELFGFLELTPLERRLGRWFVRRYALKGPSRDPHVRNPASGQWREHFTPRVKQAFDARYRALVRKLGYPAD